MIRKLQTLLFAFIVASAASAQDMSMQLKLANGEFVMGEPVLSQFTLLNASRSEIQCGTEKAAERILVEISKSGTRHEPLSSFNDEPPGGTFKVATGETISRTIELDKWFPLLAEGKYLVRVVLLRGGMRYESAYKSFDIVPGIKLQEGFQMFTTRQNLRRTFRLVYWRRNQVEHLFLRVFDEPGARTWDSIDLGVLLRTTPPRLDIAPNGEVTVVHRATQDAFLRTVLWSLPESLEIAEQNQLLDPSISASQRAKSLYNEMLDDGAKKREDRPWWKFW